MIYIGASLLSMFVKQRIYEKSLVENSSAMENE